MPPVFAVSGGVGLALLRGLATASCLSVFGTLAFRWVVPDAAVAGTLWRRLLGGGLVVALGANIGWLWWETAQMADAGTAADILAALPLVLGQTRFGAMLLARLGLLAAVAALALWRRVPPWRLILAGGLAGLAVAVQAGFGHAFAMAGSNPSDAWLAVAGLVHPLAAGAWLGALLPLLAVIRRATLPQAMMAARRFSRYGLAAVLLLVASAAALASVLAGGWAGLVGTAYGWVILLKLGLLLALGGLAAWNAGWLAPSLAGFDPAPARLLLVATVLAEAALGLLAVLAAGLLASLPPGMRM